MKTIKAGIVILSVVLLITACNKENSDLKSVKGTYYGNLVHENVLKNTTANSEIVQEDTIAASAEVNAIGKDEIEIHCVGNDFDTTFTMNYYMHHDSAYVCFSGNQFEEMYGHMHGQGHMAGMMNNMNDGETEWMHHLEEDHNAGDEHFGGFDMTKHTFGYNFQMGNGDGSYMMKFQGTRK